MSLLLSEAHQVLFAALQAADRLSCAETIAVVDSTGDRIAQARVDDAWPDAGDLAYAKAFAACVFDLDTARLAEDDHPVRRLFGEPAPEWAIYAGGVPLHRDGAVIGAVGVVGGSAAQDASCARSAARTCLHFS